MRESEVEKALRLAVEHAGGVAYKWVSPGRIGVPDRVCVFPGGRVIFVEVKSPTGRLRPAQETEIARLQSMGQRVLVISTPVPLDAFEKIVGRMFA